MSANGLCQCGCGQATKIATRTDRPKGYAKGQPRKYIVGHNGRGRPLAPEHRSKISATLSGYQKSPAHRGALSASLAGKHIGEASSRWKGDSAGYIAIHEWVRRSKPRTGVCTNCGEEGRTEWSNVDHTYRRNLDDYVELCHRCHHNHDVRTGLILPLHQRRGAA